MDWSKVECKWNTKRAWMIDGYQWRYVQGKCKKKGVIYIYIWGYMFTIYTSRKMIEKPSVYTVYLHLLICHCKTVWFFLFICSSNSTLWPCSLVWFAGTSRLVLLRSFSQFQSLQCFFLTTISQFQLRFCQRDLGSKKTQEYIEVVYI